MAVAIRGQVYRGILREESAWPEGESNALHRHDRKIFRSASIATTEIYTHVSDEALRSTLERADVLASLVKR